MVTGRSMEQTNDTFEQFDLSAPIRQTVEELGYELPTPIQRKTIPLMLQGRDVIGQAQTGTGKTAAFALPILEKLDVDRKEVQALVLTPTRELSIQVAEAFHTYSKNLGTVRVLPVYGGQYISRQITRLNSGVQVVVGTPGRIMDHLRRGTLNFDALKTVVLDEADEMLRMGFIEDVEWILSQASGNLQIALFSATLPNEIRRIADRYLHNPVTVEIEHKTMTVPNTDQRYVIVSEGQKLDSLSHVLETELAPGEAALIFVQTKLGAADLADKLQSRGFAAEAMHGDMNQPMRENVVQRLRSGELEIVVATDVAARGWDVERIGLVINYDIPYDAEDYVHRIGRTGRAGRPGRALLFVTPRQKRLLREIERFTGQKIEPFKMPSRADVVARRVTLFKERILNSVESDDLDMYLNLVEELAEESDHDMAEIAAGAARLARGDQPLEVAMQPLPEETSTGEQGMVSLFIDAGRTNGVRPADIVGAIANEADIPGNTIGAIDIHDRFSLVDVPKRYLDQVLQRMDGATIRSRDARIRIATQREEEARGPKGGGYKHKGRKVFQSNKKKPHKK